MMQHNLSCWPLVLSVSKGQPDLAELQDYSSQWTSWLARDESFAVLKIFLDSDSHTHPPGAAKEEKHWLAANGERFAQQVVGMASVAPTPLLEKIQKMKLERLFGVPAQSFAFVEEALDWLIPLLQAGRTDIQGASLKVHVLQQCLQMVDLHDIYW